MSKATGRHLWWPDSELTAQAGLATSCGEEEGGEAGAQVGVGCRGPKHWPGEFGLFTSKE